jgi:hypothetical protein
MSRDERKEGTWARTNYRLDAQLDGPTSKETETMEARRDERRRLSMLSKILIPVAVIIGGSLVVVALQPADFRVTRSATIAAPPAAVFAQVNDLHNWQAWSPWEKLDPGLKRSYVGAPAGTGAVYAWVGDKKVGEGRMTVTESRPSELIRLKLEFLMVGILMTQRAWTSPSPPDVCLDFWTSAYQAIDD